MSMSTTSTVITCVVVAAGLRLTVDFTNKAPHGQILRPLIGGALLVGALLLVAEFWPDGATMLAILVAATSVVMNGKPFLDLVIKFAK